MDPGNSATNDCNQVVPSCPTVKSEKQAVVAVEEELPRWLFTAAELDDTPSRQDKMDKAQERQIRKSVCRFLEELGRTARLRVSIVATNSAKVFFHRFFMVQSLVRQDPKLAVATCLFVACKSEECLRQIKCFIWGLNQIETDPVTGRASYPFGKSKDKDRPHEIEEDTEAFQEMRAKILQMERVILQVIGFDFNVDHPTAYFPFLIRFFQRKDLRKENTETRELIITDEEGLNARESDFGLLVMQTAQGMANDCNSTTLCLQFGGLTLAISCFSLALKSKKYILIKMKYLLPIFLEACRESNDVRLNAVTAATVPWKGVQDASHQLLDLYDEHATEKSAAPAISVGVSQTAAQHPSTALPGAKPSGGGGNPADTAGAVPAHKPSSMSGAQQTAGNDGPSGIPQGKNQMQLGAHKPGSLSNDRVAMCTKLERGEVVLYPGSSSKPYELVKRGDVYQCSCSIWRHIADLESRRTCRHLQHIRGDKAELGRVGEEGVMKCEAKFKELAQQMQRQQGQSRGPAYVATPPVQSGGLPRQDKRHLDSSGGRDPKRQMM